LRSSPVAVAFLDKAPSGVEKWDAGAVPSGCTFWRYAMDGETFYTEAGDHYNCAVGSYTHGIPLPPERAKELEETVGFMVSSGYIEIKEVPGIPVLPAPPKVVAYGPVGGTPFAADVVLVSGPPAAVMLLYEASLRAGAGNAMAATMGRPGCAALPAAKSLGMAVLSFGCRGNRTFVGLPEHEMYFVVPANKWSAVSESLRVILRANEAMGAHYDGKKQHFPILRQ